MSGPFLKGPFFYWDELILMLNAEITILYKD